MASTQLEDSPVPSCHSVTTRMCTNQPRCRTVPRSRTVHTPTMTDEKRNKPRITAMVAGFPHKLNNREHQHMCVHEQVTNDVQHAQTQHRLGECVCTIYYTPLNSFSTSTSSISTTPAKSSCRRFDFSQAHFSCQYGPALLPAHSWILSTKSVVHKTLLCSVNHGS